jgi:GMP synthase-like glutamine amidotransferase
MPIIEGIEKILTPIYQKYCFDAQKIEKQIKEHQLSIKNKNTTINRNKKILSKIRNPISILIIDISQGLYKEELIPSDLHDFLIQEQFGNLTKSHSSILVNILALKSNSCIKYDIWYPEKQELIDISKYDYWICGGGPAMPSELKLETKNTPWLQKTVDILNQLQSARIPGFAICLGHQLFAYMNGAKVGKSSNYPEFGSTKVKLTRSKKIVKIIATHFESILTRPKNATVVGCNSYNNFQFLEYKLNNNSKVFTVQNHPEFFSFYMEVMRFIRFDKILNPRNIIKNCNNNIMQKIAIEILKSSKIRKQKVTKKCN